MIANFGNYNDTIYSSGWNYGWTEVRLNGGADYLSMPTNAQYAVVYAGEGNDVVYASNNNDAIYGDGGADAIYGWNGNDWLIGGYGNDLLNGGQGVDSLWGGYGADTLSGREGTDYFHFMQPNESIGSAGYADTITDWDVRYDYIQSPVQGTSTNYGEYQTNSSNITTIANQILNSSWQTTKDNVFAYNTSTDTGYLFMDTNGDNYFDQQVIMQGAGAASDMNYSDIL